MNADFNALMDQVRANHERVADNAALDRAVRIEYWRSCKCWPVDVAAHLAFGIVDREELSKAKYFDLDYAMAAAKDATEDPIFAAFVAVSKRQEFEEHAARDGMSDKSAPAEWDAFFDRHAYPGLPQADTSKDSGTSPTNEDVTPSNQRERKGGQNSVARRRERAYYFEIQTEFYHWGVSLSNRQFEKRVLEKLARMMAPGSDGHNAGRRPPKERTIATSWAPDWRKSMQSTG
jgi:hypothetical protein